MNTLTKEYFDKHLSAHTVRIEKEVEKLGAKIDNVEANLATMIAKGFADIEKRLDVRERVEKLEKKMTKVETALNVHL